MIGIDPNDIDALITALRVHLDAGRVGQAGLMSSSQMNYRDAYHALCCAFSEIENTPGEYDHPHVRKLRAVINRNGAEAPTAIRIFALNTRQLGREAEYEIARDAA